MQTAGYFCFIPGTIPAMCCPECGGEMEVTDGEYKQTGGDGYLTPPEYTAIWEEMTCTHCGHKESNEPSY